jgi:dTDP-4-amino-4,6-dideoxygalactose transaminase
MITTNDEKLYQKLLSLRTHGITKNENSFINDIAFAGGNETYPGWYMEMQELGFNYRLTDFQAALGSSQLKRADDGLINRRKIAERYHQAFNGKAFIEGQSGAVEGHAYHLYIIEVRNRLSLYNHLKEKGIFAQIHYIPCHLMPYYRRFGWKENDMPAAEEYYSACISLPMYPTLTVEEQNFVIQEIEEFYEN